MKEHGLLKVSGADAVKLLQGQLTCNITAITPEQGSLGAHCNPQGRIISLFYLFLYQDAYYLLMPHSLLPIAMQALKKYAMFYKHIELIDVSDAAGNDELIHTHAKSYFSSEIPRIYAETSGLFLPHDIHLHQLGAISFDKGCYTGQEIIARMHYRGKLKNHLYLANISSTQAPVPGQDIYCENQRIAGTVVDVRATEHKPYLALIITDEANAKNNHLFLSNHPQEFFTIENVVGTK